MLGHVSDPARSVGNKELITHGVRMANEGSTCDWSIIVNI